jgi:hypothetical protein
MNYDNFDLIVNNINKQIKIYKYNKNIEKEDKDLFLDAFKNWEIVSDDIILIVKELMAKYTDNNIKTTGYTTSDTITLFGNDKHYYVYFTNNNIDIYYVEGTYETNVNIDSFDVLLMMLSY